MKLIVLMLIIFIATTGKALTVREVVTQWKDTIQPYADECMKESGAKSTPFNDLYLHENLDSDYHMKCNIKCYCIKLKVMQPDGSVDAQRWSELFLGMTPQIAEKCTVPLETDLCEMTYKMGACVVAEIFPTLEHEKKEN